jgi:hypothetical protein
VEKKRGKKIEVDLSLWKRRFKSLLQFWYTETQLRLMKSTLSHWTETSPILKLARLRKMRKNVSVTERPSLGQSALEVRATPQLHF